MPEKRFEEYRRVVEGRGMIVGALATGEDVHTAAGLIVTAAGADATERELAYATACLGDLRADRLDFPVALSDEMLPLAARVELLTVFVRGFLSGLGQAGERLATVGADGVEMLSDLDAISRGAALEGEATTDAEERAYRELLEYLRLAAAYFYRVLG